MPNSNQPALSVVIPARNEAENLAGLVPEIATAVGDRTYEVVVVDDGSTDDTAATIERLASGGLPVRRVVHAQSLGQSAALCSGVMAARGPIVVTLDGDGQNDPADTPKLLALLRSDPGLAMVSGVRVKRQDKASRRLASRLGNGFRNALLGDGASDTGCGLKAFHRDMFLGLPYFDHMHRFLIALIQREGGKVGYAPVNHRPRLQGASKYTNFGRLLVSVHDLLGVRWLQRRHRGPSKTEEL